MPTFIDTMRVILPQVGYQCRNSKENARSHGETDWRSTGHSTDNTAQKFMPHKLWKNESSNQRRTAANLRTNLTDQRR
jgi:hypothetical protein